jgi:hydroxyacylglutathione hydrolase
MKLLALQALTDNYIWMLHNGTEALVVDPGESASVFEALQSLQLTLVGILVTHHHPDHVQGITPLLKVLNGDVYGPAFNRHTATTRALQEGDTFELLGLQFDVWEVPGHTNDHIAFYLPPSIQGASFPSCMFVGDTLFSAGCGRVFNGTVEQLYRSLQRIASLPKDLLIYCSHEYTLSNLRFAQAVEPDNALIQEHTDVCQTLRQSNQPTLPTTLELEHQINPFLRCMQTSVVKTAVLHGALSTDSLSVFATLRQWKNRFV